MSDWCNDAELPILSLLSIPAQDISWSVSDGA